MKINGEKKLKEIIGDAVKEIGYNSGHELSFEHDDQTIVCKPIFQKDYSPDKIFRFVKQKLLVYINSKEFAQIQSNLKKQNLIIKKGNF